MSDGNMYDILPPEVEQQANIGKLISSLIRMGQQLLEDQEDTSCSLPRTVFPGPNISTAALICDCNNVVYYCIFYLFIYQGCKCINKTNIV